MQARLGNLASWEPILFLMSGRVLRMWCMRMVLSLRARKGVRSIAPCCGSLGGFEELFLRIESGTDELLLVDVALTTVDDGNVAETKGNDTTGENVDDIGACIHQIDLVSTPTYECLRIDFAGELETIRVGQIGVGRSDGKDDGVGLRDELEHHVSDLSLNVARLIADRHLGETGRSTRVSVRTLGL